MAETYIHDSEVVRLEHLPPVEAARILEPLGRIGYKAFREEYAIEPPYNPDGTVDIDAAVAQVRSLVSPDYRWSAPFFDQHHIYFERARYTPDKWDGDTIPLQFREIPTNQIYPPRGFHNFWHCISGEPKPPERDVMMKDIEEYRLNHYLHELVSESIRILERIERAKYDPKRDLYVDIKSRRSYTGSTIDERREKFIRTIEKSFEDKREPDLGELSILQSVRDRRLVTARNALSAKIARNGRRIGHPVSVPIDAKTLVAA